MGERLLPGNLIEVPSESPAYLVDIATLTVDNPTISGLVIQKPTRKIERLPQLVQFIRAETNKPIYYDCSSDGCARRQDRLPAYLDLALQAEVDGVIFPAICQMRSSHKDECFERETMETLRKNGVQVIVDVDMPGCTDTPTPFAATEQSLNNGVNSFLFTPKNLDSARRYSTFMREATKDFNLYLSCSRLSGVSILNLNAHGTANIDSWQSGSWNQIIPSYAAFSGLNLPNGSH